MKIKWTQLGFSIVFLLSSVHEIIFYYIDDCILPDIGLKTCGPAAKPYFYIYIGIAIISLIGIIFSFKRKEK